MKVSVVIPVLDEAAGIARAIARLRQSSRGVEIVVVDGGSSDGTCAAARGLADRLIRSARPGRAAQMQLGASAASGEVLLFLHADTRLPADWQRLLTEAWSAEDRPAATAFRLGFDSGEPFYALLSRLGNLRTALTGVPHGDQAIAVSRAEFLRVGGFPAVPLMEEYLLLAKLRGSGRLRVLDAAVATSCRRYERNGRLLNALRNAALVTLYHLGVPPRRLAELYR